MSKENLKDKNSNRESREKEILQIEEELIEESGMEAEKWIEKYAKNFREKVIPQHPELLEEYLQDKEKTKKKIKELLENTGA